MSQIVDQKMGVTNLVEGGWGRKWKEKRVKEFALSKSWQTTCHISALEYGNKTYIVSVKFNYIIRWQFVACAINLLIMESKKENKVNDGYTFFDDTK